MLLARYINTASRRACLAEREATEAPLFSRMVLHHVPSVPSLGGAPQNHGMGGPGSAKRHSSIGSRPNVTLRRTPSPQSRQRGRAHTESGSESPRVTHRVPSPTKRRVHADSAPSHASPGVSHRNTHGHNSTPSMAPATRRISLEEISRSRSSSTGSHGGGGHGGGGIPPPIREDSLTFSVPSSPSDIRGPDSPKFDRATSSSGANGGGNGRPLTPPPRRSSTVSSLESPTRKISASKRTSRVLVMPSVAMYSYSPENTSAAGHSDVPQQRTTSST